MNFKTIMIIDDSEADHFLAKDLIEKYNPNITVLQAYDGEEALEILAPMEKQPDVIFLDINMPRMNGHEFLKNYSQKDKQAPVIVMLTSSDQEKDRERSQAYKCVKKYYSKPLDITVLEEIKNLK